MKKNRPDPKVEAEKTLGILDSLKRIEADPLLFEKIRNRMEADSPAPKIKTLPLTLIKYAAACFLLALNLYIILPEYTSLNTAAKEDQLEELVSEYALSYEADNLFGIN